MARLDPVWSASRLATAACAVAADMLHARLAGFPRRVEECSAAWLADALEPAFPGLRLRDIALLDHHSGTTSRARIALDWESAGAGGPPPPATLFLKLTPREPVQRLFLAATGIGRNELRFYRAVRPGLPVRAPQLYGLRRLGAGRQFVLLLEDLAAGQVRLPDLTEQATPREAQAVVEALAALHAAFWESPRFSSDLAWLPDLESRRHDRPWERFLTGRMIARARRRFETSFPAGFGAIAALCSERRDALEQLWSRGDRTLVHGDCHLGNLFFEGERVGLLDWQVCARAPGMRDVSYFLCSSLATEQRRRHERALLARYLEALRAHGVAASDPAAAWRQHRLFALYTWIAAAFTAAAGDRLQASRIGAEALRRATAAVCDLESVACAREG